VKTPSITMKSQSTSRVEKRYIKSYTSNEAEEEPPGERGLCGNLEEEPPGKKLLIDTGFLEISPMQPGMTGSGSSRIELPASND